MQPGNGTLHTRQGQKKSFDNITVAEQHVLQDCMQHRQEQQTRLALLLTWSSRRQQEIHARIRPIHTKIHPMHRAMKRMKLHASPQADTPCTTNARSTAARLPAQGALWGSHLPTHPCSIMHCRLHGAPTLCVTNGQLDLSCAGQSRGRQSRTVSITTWAPSTVSTRKELGSHAAL